MNINELCQMSDIALGGLFGSCHIFGKTLGQSLYKSLDL